MDEIKILEHAKDYLNSLSKGINPLTKNPTEKSSVVNEEKIQKCFVYVVSVLDEVIKKGGISGINTASCKPTIIKDTSVFFLSTEQKENVINNIGSNIVGLNKICDYLNLIKSSPYMPSINQSDIEKWLAKEGYISEIILDEELKTKDYKATNAGLASGVLSLVFTQNGLKYIKTTYNKEMQKTIVNNVNEMQNIITI